jgi:DNA polymerase III subunit delta
MIIFLYGPDSFRSRQKLNEIVAQYKEKHKKAFNLKFFDCDEQKVDIAGLKDELRQTSMFKEKKLLVVSNLFNDTALKEKFLKEAKDFVASDEVVLIYESGEIKAADKLFKFLVKEAKAQEFKNLDGKNLRLWIKKEVQDKKGKIEDMAVEILADYINDDLWLLSNEISKMINFKKNRTITSQDVKSSLKPKIENDIFRTIDAIAQKNKRQALNLLANHLEDGEKALYLLSMIGYQFRNLLVVKELAEKGVPFPMIAKRSGLHPFVARKSYDTCRLFSFADLKKIYRKIFQVDLDVKTGKLEQEMALELLIAGI